MAKIKINGTEKDFSEGLPATVAELLELLNIQAATVVAEIDGRIIESKNFCATRLTDGQNIELIRFVPGG